jgi:hypothetical protein
MIERGYSNLSNMKNIIIINSYANSQEKLDVLFNYILKVKKTNHDLLLISHLPTPSKIIEQVKYYIYDKENFLLPIERSPVVWFADFEEYINLHCSRHAYAIVKNFYTALNFIKSLGYDNFIFSDGDNIITDNAIPKYNTIFDTLENTNKKIFVFKMQNQIYNKYNILYRTNFFAGNVNYFIKNIPLVKSFEEWCTTPPYSIGSEMLETLFVEMTRPLLNDIHEELLHINSYFNDSQIDVFHTFDNYYSIIYNLEDKSKPLFFTISKGGHYELSIDNKIVISSIFNVGQIIKCKFDINEKNTTVILKHDGIVVATKCVNINSVESYKSMGVRNKIK